MAGESLQSPAGHEQDGFCGFSQHHNVENHMHMYPLQDLHYNKRPQKQIRELISWWRTIWPRHWVYCSYCLSPWSSNSFAVCCCSEFCSKLGKAHMHTQRHNIQHMQHICFLLQDHQLGGNRNSLSSVTALYLLLLATFSLSEKCTVLHSVELKLWENQGYGLS